MLRFKLKMFSSPFNHPMTEGTPHTPYPQPRGPQGGAPSPPPAWSCSQLTSHSTWRLLISVCPPVGIPALRSQVAVDGELIRADPAQHCLGLQLLRTPQLSSRLAEGHLGWLNWGLGTPTAAPCCSPPQHAPIPSCSLGFPVQRGAASSKKGNIKEWSYLAHLPGKFRCL